MLFYEREEENRGRQKEETEEVGGTHSQGKHECTRIVKAGHKLATQCGSEGNTNTLK